MFAAFLLAIPLLFSLWGNASIADREVFEPADIAPGRFATIDGVTMHYQLWGNPGADRTGAPIVLIHGFASSSLEYFRLAPILAGSRSVVAVDLAGFGFSERLLEAGPQYSHRGQAELVAGLLDGLGISRADVVGASYGGAIAGQLALDRPSLVRQIVFLDAQIYAEGSGPGGIVARLPLGLNRALTWLTLGGGPLSSRLFDLACFEVAACQAGGDLTEIFTPPTTIRGNVRGLIAFSRSPADQRLPTEVVAIRQPALVIWGRHDAIVPPENGVRLAEDLPNARLVFIENAGHVPHIERPAETARLILDFLP